MSEEKEKSVGAIWVKEGKTSKFMSIQIEVEGKKHSFVGFKNKFKKEAKHPDYQIFPAKGQSDQPKTEAKKPAPKDDDIF